jgi:hypothetical protein
MCILPNFAEGDLAEYKRKRKEERKKAEAETVEIIVPEQPLLEESV